MEGLVFGGIALVAFVATVVFGLAERARTHRGYRRTLRGTARAAGLTDVRFGSGFPQDFRFSARAGPLGVGLTIAVPDEKTIAVMTVDGLRHDPSELSFTVEDLGTRLGAALGQREIELGDGAFDNAVWLRGSPLLAHALFDAGTRSTVLQMIEGGFGVPGSSRVILEAAQVALANGTLKVQVRGQHLPFDHLCRALPAVVALGKRLVKPDQLVPRLAGNAREDPVPRVRLGNLRLLADRHPSHPLTRETLRAALTDADPDIVLAAAAALGEEARPTLLAIATGEESLDHAAARAIAALGDGLAAEDVEPLLARALRHRQPATARACLMRLGRAGGVARLAQVLAVERGELARAAAEALAATGSAEAQAPLLAALERDDPALQPAVVRALGEVGTAAAVAPLRAAAAAPGAAAGREAAVKEAVRRIQSRLTSAEAGQLSIAEAGGGELSLAEAGAGRRQGALSLAESQPTRNGAGAAPAPPSPVGRIPQA